MRQKSHATDLSSEEVVKGIRRATRKRYSAEEKIRIVLDGLRGEHSIAELWRREGIAEGLHYSWSKRCGGDNRACFQQHSGRASVPHDEIDREEAENSLHLVEAHDD